MLTLTAVGGYFTLRSVVDKRLKAMKRGPKQSPAAHLRSSSCFLLSPNTPTLTLAKRSL